jgi:hypothetical protein
MTPDLPASTCPHCKSNRVYRSHRRGITDHFFSRLGGQLRRCHDCHYRHVRFGFASIPLGIREQNEERLANFTVTGVAWGICLLVAWYVIRHFSATGG